MGALVGLADGVLVGDVLGVPEFVADAAPPEGDVPDGDPVGAADGEADGDGDSDGNRADIRSAHAVVTSSEALSASVRA